MAKQSGEQQKILEFTLHEYKSGKLKSGSGAKVKNPKQAIAIGLKEAGASKNATPSENKHNLSQTKHKINGNKKKI